MGDEQGGPLVLLQCILEHLLGGDVEVVGGLIQHQQVAGGEQHQGQGQPGLLAAAELAGLLEHRLVAEAEAAQQRAHLGLGPVGHRLEHRVDHRLGEIEGLGLVLLEVAGHHVVLPQPGEALIGGLQAHHQTQQRRLAGAVRPHEGDAIAPLHLQVGPEEQDPLAIAVGEVVDPCHQAAGAGGGREVETWSGDALQRRLDPLHLLQQLLPAFGLGGAGGAGAEAVDVGLLAAQLLLLPLEGGLAGLPFQGLLLEVLAVVAQIGARDAPLGLHDLRAHPVEEGAVVADHDQGGALAHQVVLQPLDRFHVQVVGGLVEQQKIRLLQQDLAQGQPHLPAAGVVAHQVLGFGQGETDRGHEPVDARVELIAVQGLEAALQPAQLLDQVVEVIGIGGGALPGHLLLHDPLAAEHLGRLTEGLEQFLADRAGRIHVEFLLQIGNARIALAHDLAAAWLLHSGDDPQLGGLAGPVHPHQTDPIARLHLPGDVPEHLTGGIDLADAFKAQHGSGNGVIPAIIHRRAGRQTGVPRRLPAR